MSAAKQDDHGKDNKSLTRLECVCCKYGPSKEVEIFQKAMANRIPIVRPIIDTDYIFTMGIPLLAPGTNTGELLINGLPVNMAAKILTDLGKKIVSGDLKQSEWKEGTILVPSQTDMNVDFKVHVLDSSDIDTYMGSTRRAHFGIPRTLIAYQLYWADKDNKFTEKVISAQQLL